MKWFGEPWPSAEYRAPACEDDAERVPPPPPGELCVLCDEAIEADDSGVVMPHITVNNRVSVRYSHLGCLLLNVTGGKL